MRGTRRAGFRWPAAVTGHENAPRPSGGGAGGLVARGSGTGGNRPGGFRFATELFFTVAGKGSGMPRLVTVRRDEITGEYRVTCDVCGKLATLRDYWRAAYMARDHEAIHADEG